MGAIFQIDIKNKRERSKLSRIAGIAKKGYHRQLRYRPIEEDEVGGHLVRKYTGGWMY